MILSNNYATKIIKVPPLAESITEGTISKWNKKAGDSVQQDEEIVTIETDKVDAPVNSPYSGKIIEIYANEQDNIVVGQDLCKVELGDAAASDSPKQEPEPESKQEQKPESKQELEPESKQDTTPPPPEPEPSTPATPPKPPPASSTPPPSASPKPPPSAPPTPPPPPTSAPSPPSKPSSKTKGESPYGEREDREVKMNRMRLRIAERLKESQDTAASLTTFNEIDMTNIIDLRNTYKDAILKKHGIKLGFMSAFVRASSVALQEVPAVNASIAESGDTIIYRDYVDMSVAVATPKGLVTPVIRNAHLLSFIEIEKVIAELGQKARDGKMTIEDMAGGTFTISNGGVFGSLLGTPIINLPQSGILGMHATKDRPVAINGNVEIRPMMYIALTYDHRLIDGREAVTFLKTVKEQVEDPRRLLLNI
ncbi:dihydrolipoamide succinyltransferase [Gigaspora margarita]|uniref:dihydrolipoyllysine-residue succinyltransferase n=1 Tax=Gigaspora margarita TaxID=4874 RepID=A0A8H4ETR6_GIGMA|nr:dihydrolipoamide succinyltransferase [Gigaspora margarita]